MIEVERKYKVTVPHATELAARVFAGSAVRQVDEVYLVKTSSWGTFTPGDPVLRLRQQGSEVTLTVKAARDTQTALEADLPLASLAAGRAFLSVLNATKVNVVTKARREGRFEEVTVAVDEVESLGCFVELEVVVNSEAEEADAERRLTRAAEELGLAASGRVTKRYDVLLAELSRES